MRRGRILILLGLVLALGAAAVVFILLQGATQTQTGPAVEREEVVVAKQPIAEGDLVAERLELESMPVEAIGEGALRELAGTEDMLATGPIPQGAIVYQDMLQTPEEQMREGRLGNLVETGYQAMAFPIDELSSVSYGVQPGDYVDVIMTLAFVDVDQETQIEEPVCPPICPAAEGAGGEAQVTGQRQRLVTQLTVQDILVLGVGRWEHKVTTTDEQQQQQGEQEGVTRPPEYITLMLEPQDALVLKLAREQEASIDLAIRNADDHQTFENIQPVTLDYILARYGISVPPKQNYTIELLESQETTE